MKTFLTAIFISLTVAVFAQDQLQLAMQYYNAQEYEKAAVLFQKLYNQRKTKFYFDYYLRCLERTGQTDKALKAINREVRRHPGDLRYLVDKAYFLSLQGKHDEAEKINREVLRRLPPNPAEIKQIANAYIRHRDYEQAAKVLQAGKKITGQNFYQMLYTVYALQRNYDKMIDVLLDWLGTDPSQFAYIQRMLTSYMQNDVNDEFSSLLYRKIMLRVQKSKDPVYLRLLVWYFTEKKQFDMAVVQAIAYDRRIRGFGSQVYDVGMMALDNDSLSAAKQAFDYLIKKGMRSPYYLKARQALLKVYYNQVLNGEIRSPEQIRDLEQQYVSIINELGINEQTADLLIDLAHLEAFYLDKPDKALEYLDQTLAIPNLDPQIRGKLLTEKGKILLRLHKPYDAILLFARAYDINKDNAVGDQAVYLQALTYYFLENFTWAKTQFDILKGATDKLIANDAIFYAGLLRQATEDSTKLPVMKQFAKAQFYEYINENDSALALLDSVVSQAFFLADLALLEKYKIFYKSGQYEKAAQALQQLINNFSYSLYVDKAIYLLARLYEQKLGEPQKALEYYKKLLFDYKGSIYTDDARLRYRALKQKLQNTSA